MKTRPDWFGRFFSVRLGVGMKKHWRKESRYADMVAVWQLWVTVGLWENEEHDLYGSEFD